MEKSKFAVILDNDGTLSQPDFKHHGTWARMDNFILDSDRIITTQFLRRHFTEVMLGRGMSPFDHLGWLEMTVQAWKECQLRREHIDQVFGDNGDHLRPGLGDFLRWLKQEREDREVVVVINSYGIRQFIERMLLTEGLLELVDEILAIPLIFDEEGFCTGYTEIAIIDAETKGKFTEQLLYRHGIPPHQAVGIGDSSGDRFIAPVHRLHLASDADHVERYREHFTASCISPNDWSGPRTWLEEHFGL